ncbi:MAG: hypothetical protein MJ238_02605 [Bacilli bacterium]|nr:hypothetical protein [Bacilli bacterium]
MEEEKYHVKLINEIGCMEDDFEQEEIESIISKFVRSDFIPSSAFSNPNSRFDVEELHYYGIWGEYAIVQFVYEPHVFDYLYEEFTNKSFSPRLAYSVLTRDMLQVSELYERGIFDDSQMHEIASSGYLKRIQKDGDTVTHDVYVSKKIGDDNADDHKYLFDIYGNQYFWFSDILHGSFNSISQKVAREEMISNNEEIARRFNKGITVDLDTYLVGIAQSYIYAKGQDDDTLVHIQYYGRNVRSFYLSVWSDKDTFDGPYKESYGEVEFENENGHHFFVWIIGHLPNSL